MMVTVVIVPVVGLVVEIAVVSIAVLPDLVQHQNTDQVTISGAMKATGEKTRSRPAT